MDCSAIASIPQAVHPHACGENTGDTQHARLFVWYTPTPVGKTASVDEMRDGLSVHPHACGENTNPEWPSVTVTGTPPRLWGKQTTCPTHHAFVRYTPTPVGKTVWMIVVNLTPWMPGTPPRLWGKLHVW